MQALSSETFNSCDKFDNKLHIHQI